VAMMVVVVYKLVVNEFLLWRAFNLVRLGVVFVLLPE